MLAGLLAVALVGQVLLTADPAEVRPPVCATSTPVQLFGQAVPRAAYVPCVPRVYTGGVTGGTSTVHDGLGVAYATLPEGGRVTETYGLACPEPTTGRLAASGLPLGVQVWAAGTGQVLFTFPGGCLRLDYPAGTLGRAELALPRLRDVVRLVPRWRLDNYVARVTDG